MNLASARGLSSVTGQVVFSAPVGCFVKRYKQPSPRTVARIQGDCRKSVPDGKGLLNVSSNLASFQGLGANRVCEGF